MPPPRSHRLRTGLSRRTALLSLLPLSVTAGTLAACSDAGAPREGEGTTGETSVSDSGGAGSGTLSVNDPWARAMPSQSAVFGTLTNGTEGDLVLVAASSPAAGEVQLHAGAPGSSDGQSMPVKENGFPLPAGEELVLEPGGNHLMLTDLTEPLQPGDEVEVALAFADGTEHQFTAPVEDRSGTE
ncbi:copper chaperone PCu(A)C [Brachybacterium sp. GCM10030252]|uniref:copper chaperone PCu(A)C n=1 Tax=Brachybacterium sp. GCM10030252 TaxID=3273380 RepID=UPI0036237D85